MRLGSLDPRQQKRLSLLGPRLGLMHFELGLKCLLSQIEGFLGLVVLEEEVAQKKKRGSGDLGLLPSELGPVKELFSIELL